MDQCAEHKRCVKDIEDLQNEVKDNTKKTEATYDAVFGRNGVTGLSHRATVHGTKIDGLETGKRSVAECTRMRDADRADVSKDIEEIKRMVEQKENRKITGTHLLIAILVPNVIVIGLTIIGWIVG